MESKEKTNVLLEGFKFWPWGMNCNCKSTGLTAAVFEETSGPPDGKAWAREKMRQIVETKKAGIIEVVGSLHKH